jgi:hypothetical protein
MGTALAVEAVPGCDCAKLASLLVEQLAKCPLGWDWVLDLEALPSCDERFVDLILAIEGDLRRGGGELVVVGLDRVPMPAVLRNRFLTGNPKTRP